MGKKNQSQIYTQRWKCQHILLLEMQNIIFNNKELYKIPSMEILLLYSGENQFYPENM